MRRYTKVTLVTVRVHADFRGPDPTAMRAAVSWNLCLRGAEKYGACAWKSDQVFSKQEEVVIKGVSVVSGEARATNCSPLTIPFDSRNEGSKCVG
jgi:hypothetical protein